MSRGFSNSIVGGIGTLIRTFVQSLGFVSGSTGWRISRDGSAEFNNITGRGTLTIGPATGSRIVITNVIPTELAAYYNPTVLSSVILFYDTNGDYIYEGSVVGGGRVIGARTGASVLESDFLQNGGGNIVHYSTPIAYESNKAVETWQTLTLLNGFTNRGAGFPVLSWHHVVTPVANVNLGGAVLLGEIVSGATVASGTQIATMPVGSRPATEIAFPVSNASTSVLLTCTISTAGVVKLFGTWANGNIIDLNGSVPFDSV